MVDVGAKGVSAREAVARGIVQLGPEAFAALQGNRLAKGDALAVARIAGIQAAKRTAEWIPLCHAIPLDHVAVDFALDEPGGRVRVEARVRARAVTGVEMEALTATAAACLALYDMVKGVDRAAAIREIRLVLKRGGRGGLWRAGEEEEGP